MLNEVHTNGHAPIKFPTSHQVGMAVPVGGSNCMKCEYVDGQECKNKTFVKWNGSSTIPQKTDRYCCDFFEGGDKPSRIAQVFTRSKQTK